MNKQSITWIGLGIIGLVAAYFTLTLLGAGGIKSLDHISITPIDHASMIIQWDEQIIVVDPIGDARRYETQGVADMVLITDIHGDHLSTSTLQQLDTEESTLVVPDAVIKKLGGSVYFKEIEVMDNFDVEQLDSFTIKAIPMYNVPETDDAFHPRGRGNGYVIEKDGVRVYIAGDTGNHRQVRRLENIDIAFVPMNMPYTMTEEDAAKAVLAFVPRIVYPYHYRGQDQFSDIEKFKQLVHAENPEIEVRLGNWYPEIELGTSEISTATIDPEIQTAFETAARTGTSQSWQEFIKANRDHPLADEARFELNILRGISNN